MVLHHGGAGHADQCAGQSDRRVGRHGPGARGGSGIGAGWLGRRDAGDALGGVHHPASSRVPASAPSSGLFGGVPVLGHGPLLALQGRGAVQSRGGPATARQHTGVPMPAAGTPLDQGERTRGRPRWSTADFREITDLLGKLGCLRDSGALSDKEFVEQKQRLLGSQ